VSHLAAIGKAVRIQGFALAGVATCPTATPEHTCAAWPGQGDQVAVVILTPRAAGRLAGQLDRCPAVLTAGMPP
jgi:vacuolar-type H+-ATPase subunit F/Vma7